MDWTEVSLFVLLILVVAFVAGAISDLVMDQSSNLNCQVLNYDGGTHPFWQFRTVCYNIIQEEIPAEYEYFPLK